MPFREPLPRRPLHDTSHLVFDTGKPLISGLFTSRTLGGLTSAVEVPVLVEGKVASVLAMTITAGRLDDLLRRQNLPHHGVAALLNGVGTIVARTRDSEKFVGSKGSAELIRRAATDADGTYTGDSLEGLPVLTAFSRSRRSGWTGSIDIPSATLTENLWNSVMFDAVVTVVLLGLSMWVARAISIRIERSIGSLSTPPVHWGPANYQRSCQRPSSKSTKWVRH